MPICRTFSVEKEVCCGHFVFFALQCLWSCGLKSHLMGVGNEKAQAAAMLVQCNSVFIECWQLCWPIRGGEHQLSTVLLWVVFSLLAG